MVLNVHKNHNLLGTGRREGVGYGGGGRGRLYTCRYTVTTKMIAAHKDSDETITLEEKGEPKRIRTEVPLLTSLTPYWPLGQTCSEK